MDELKGVQEASDKEHKQLGDQSEAYAKQLKEEALFATPPAEHVLDPDTAHASLLYHIASKEVISTGTMDHLRVKAADLDKRWQDIHGIDAVRQGLAKKQALEHQTEEFQNWLAQASLKGQSGIYRCLKAPDNVHVRPFRNVPVQDRQGLRKQQWHGRWQVLDQPKTSGERERLR